MTPKPPPRPAVVAIVTFDALCALWGSNPVQARHRLGQLRLHEREDGTVEVPLAWAENWGATPLRVETIDMVERLKRDWQREDEADV